MRESRGLALGLINVMSKQPLPWAFQSVKNLHLLNKQMNGPESICLPASQVQV